MTTTYRTDGCGALRKEDAGRTVTLAGWLERKRNLGSLTFLLLRDDTGKTQLVVPESPEIRAAVGETRVESVVQITGKVSPRTDKDRNKAMATGEIEVQIETFSVLANADILPFPVAGPCNAPESERLRFRFLDLRRETLRKNILLRSRVVASIRRRMTAMGFDEFQTPILTASSPEGARDFLVPSRIHPGKFYALPQAPQQFKQLLMVAGFSRYFQIAPCFRDEDARADRSPGEFYQLDLEMAFVSQEDVFQVVETLFSELFREFSDFEATAVPFPRIPYRDAMLRYGTDKPDLRFGCEIEDASEFFQTSSFRLFREVVETGGVVRAVPVPGGGALSRRFYDGMDRFVKEEGGGGCAWLAFPEGKPAKGSIAKALSASAADLANLAGPGGALLLVAGPEKEIAPLAGKLRLRVADELDLREKRSYRFCFVVDFPMYERDEETGAIVFSHNPFSMPQGGLEAIETKDPLDILAYQYDIVCNGIELSSGAIRNHREEIMLKAFELAGYPESAVRKEFGGMLRAFRYGAPPHGGIAPGIDRIVMLLADATNIREVILFPFNQRAEDLLMGAPAPASDEQLKELHLKLDLPKDVDT